MDIKKVNVIKSKLSGGEGYDHFSFTQLSSPVAKYIIDYVMVNQKERRKQIKGYKLHFGSAVNNVAQKMFGKYLFVGCFICILLLIGSKIYCFSAIINYY